MSSCWKDVDLNCGHVHTFGEIWLVAAEMWFELWTRTHDWRNMSSCCKDVDSNCGNVHTPGC